MLTLPLAAPAAVSTAIAWYPSADSNVTGYNIYYGTASHTYTQMIAAGNVTNATINGLAPETTYYFSLKSRNAAGTEGGFSSETLFASFATTPASGGLRIKTLPPALKQDRLLFSLAPGSPAGAQINPTNGVVTWLPGLADANTVQSITVIITDLTNPSASTQQTLVVTVTDFLQVELPSVPVQSGATASLPLKILTSDGITNLTFSLAWPGGVLLNPQLTFNAPVAGGTLQNRGTNLCIKLWTANGDLITGTNAFAQLQFQAVAGQPSAFLSLPLEILSVHKANGSGFSSIRTASGEIVVVGTNPLLRPEASPAQGRALAVYANPGTSYQIQYATSLSAPVAWLPLQDFQATNVLQTVGLGSVNPVIFYRLLQL